MTPDQLMKETIDLEAAAVEQTMHDDRAKAIAADYGVRLVPTFGGYEFSGSPKAVERFKSAMIKTERLK